MGRAMISMTFLTPDGTKVTCEAEPGETAMQVAIRNNVDGIVAECGGSAMCGTCHVYVESDDTDGLPPPSADENALLEFVACERRANSRLSCQLKLSEGAGNLVVRVPEFQQ